MQKKNVDSLIVINLRLQPAIHFELKPELNLHLENVINHKPPLEIQQQG